MESGLEYALHVHSKARTKESREYQSGGKGAELLEVSEDSLSWDAAATIVAPGSALPGARLIYKPNFLQRRLRLRRIEMRQDTLHASAIQRHAIRRRREHKQLP